MVYTFNVGADAFPSSTSFLADMYGLNDNLSVQAWNYDTLSWEQIGMRYGNNQHTPTINAYNLLQSHVGKGVYIGDIRIRFSGTGLTSAEFIVDQLLIHYSVVTKSIGFNGKVVSGDATHIVLGSEASAIDDFYFPGLVSIYAGTGKHQYGRIASYNGGSRTITIASSFVTPPDETSWIQISPWGSVRVSDIDAGIEELEKIRKKTNMIPGLY